MSYNYSGCLPMYESVLREKNLGGTADFLKSAVERISTLEARVAEAEKLLGASQEQLEHLAYCSKNSRAVNLLTSGHFINAKAIVDDITAFLKKTELSKPEGV